MIYKKIEIEEMEHFWSLLNALDAETNFMMYEPNERKQHMDIQELETDIYHNVIHGNDFLQIAKADNKIVGYLRAERGEFHRNFHTAYIVVGVLKEYQGKGIGTTFFENLENGRRKILSFGWSLLWNVIMKQQENYMKKVILK